MAMRGNKIEFDLIPGLPAKHIGILCGFKPVQIKIPFVQ